MSRKIEFVEKMDIDKVKLWEQNPRFNDVAAERLAKVLKKHGFIDPIILDKDYIVRAGNLLGLLGRFNSSNQGSPTPSTSLYKKSNAESA